MIIGTAGHVDHGKSALVQALTGQPVDPLPEERRRGITLDLHVVPLVLRDGSTAGIVDVPGHEDLVRTMIAGAAGIDLVLFVVAANEGIMPQTREHLVVLEQLGIPAGIAVITKADLVEPGWLDLVAGEVADWVSQSPVAFSPPLAVSAATGEGIEPLRAAIESFAAQARTGSLEDLPRLPVDRVLTIPGAGTVLTGTVSSGTFRVGDTVRLLPSGHEGRIRSVERHGASVASVGRGERAALALAGIPAGLVHRGEVVVTPEAGWLASDRVDAELRVTPEASVVVGHRSRIRVCLGTAEIMARVRTSAPIGPGGAGPARLLLEAPLPVRGGDRFVLRSYSPVRVIGGGTVLDAHPPAGRPVIPDGIRAESRRDRLSLLMVREPGGVARREVAIRAGIAPGAIAGLAAAVDAELVEEILVPRSALVAAQAEARQLVEAWHRQHPASDGMPLETLRSALRPRGESGVIALERLRQAGELSISDAVVRARGHRTATAENRASLDRLVAALEGMGLAPGTIAELERGTGVTDAIRWLRIAEQEGRVEAIDRDRFVTRSALDGFAQCLAEVGSRGPITPAAVREATGLTRRHLIPLLEWADRAGLTVWRGDSRAPGPRLRPPP